MKEEWRDIAGYEGIYAVSNMGRVKRLSNAPTGGYKAGRIYEPKLMPNGYMLSRLSKDGVNKSHMTHRLVATAFIGQPPSPDSEVNHKNGVKNDNRVVNLEWVTRLENIHHSMTVLNWQPARGEQVGKSVLTETDVTEIRNLSAGGLNTVEIGKKFGISSAQVGRIVRRVQWRHVP